jgi:GLPGLI family protein
MLTIIFGLPKGTVIFGSQFAMNSFMKKLLLAAMLLAAFATQAMGQTTTGMFVYTITIDFQRDITPEMKANMGNMPAKMEVSKELLFDANHSLYRPAPDLETAESGGGGGMRRMMQNEEVFTDFDNRTTTTRHELGDDVFIVSDSIQPQQWKLTNETKEILGYTCRKAITTKEMRNRRMVVENGQQVRKEVTDTVNVIAWYAEAIPVASGPDFAGTLPGLILEMDMADGRFHTIATDFRKKFPKGELKAPEGTLITKEELKAKREEYFKAFRPHGPR